MKYKVPTKDSWFGIFYPDFLFRVFSNDDIHVKMKGVFGWECVSESACGTSIWMKFDIVTKRSVEYEMFKSLRKDDALGKIRFVFLLLLQARIVRRKTWDYGRLGAEFYFARWNVAELGRLVGCTLGEPKSVWIIAPNNTMQLAVVHYVEV